MNVFTELNSSSAALASLHRYIDTDVMGTVRVGLIEHDKLGQSYYDYSLVLDTKSW